eukprot:CAMPEP_0194565684 /NCGR_PEP_ID=MMETSP0292-20121207/4869_1 /TAXON_ID=39354 /ORGANISM="Heterosigma akashiwo, Strain CCMP2393" /LENGTH=82 /DNA_ID=CAMNT_0039415119 /DNA_START=106 /DNA_END=350 /DNA_ORIENTATION=-
MRIEELTPPTVKKMKVADLKAVLEESGLKKTGNKEVLQQRLLDFMDAAAKDMEASPAQPKEAPPAAATATAPDPASAPAPAP